MVSNKDLLNDLEVSIKEFSENPDTMFKRWNMVRRNFYNYSLQNIMLANHQLLAMEKGEVEQLATYRKWKKLGRQVRKGEKALKIIAPILISNDVDGAEDELVGFRQVPVFDIKQTTGEDYFYNDDDIKGESSISLDDAVEKSSLPVFIDLKTIIKKGETDYTKIRIAMDLTDEDKLCVLFHELAHNLLKHNEREVGKSLKEMEAESVSYIVARHFGLDNESSVRYIHNWNKDNVDEFTMESANNIVKASDEIVKMMEA